jgi:hypothetical protein
MIRSLFLVIALVTTGTPIAFAANAQSAVPTPSKEKAGASLPPPAANPATPAGPAPTGVAPANEPSDRSTAQAVANAAILQAISQVSERAIEAAHHGSTEANDLFERLVWVVGALGVIFAAFGVSSVRSLKGEVLARARDQVRQALVEVNAKAKEQVSAALVEMKNQIDSAVTHTAQTAEYARDVLLNTAEATRSFTLAKAFAETEFDKQEYFQSAVQSCLRAREAAEKLKDTKQVAWTYSFEAYCRRAQNDYEGAIKAAELSETLYQRDDPTLQYNLACYLCLAGHDGRAAERLLLAFTRNTDGSIRGYAQTEKDFDRWRAAGLYPELVGSAPERGPESETSG